MKGIIALLGGLGVGAALMYLFDPEEGEKRRIMLRDKAMNLNERAQGVVQEGVDDLSGRARGLLQEARSAFESKVGGTEANASKNDEAPMSGHEQFSH